ncbi:hypothetical protein IWQ61_009875, partial [Dispira simplex]
MDKRLGEVLRATLQLLDIDKLETSPYPLVPAQDEQSNTATTTDKQLDTIYATTTILKISITIKRWIRQLPPDE